MENIFLHLFNLSVTASYIILAVILLRFVLSKAPKWINCLLWAIVGLRLLVPFSIESIFSLVPSSEPIPSDIILSPEPQINTGIPPVNNVINPVISDTFTPDPTASANPLQILLFVVSIVWIVGVVAILLWGLISYLRLRKRVAPSILIDSNVYCCDGIDTPFVLGIFRPRIYLPSDIDEGIAHQVIAHEKAHIARLDHIWKPLGYLLLSVYWFSPLVWIAYILFCRDVEKACDERVIRDMRADERQEYSSALLSCSVSRAGINACPLAFGEVGVKSRVRSVLNYKKPAFWLTIAAIVACVAIAVGFLTNPIEKPTRKIYGETDPDQLNASQIALMEKYPEYFGLDATNGLDVYFWQVSDDYFYLGLLEHRDEIDHDGDGSLGVFGESFGDVQNLRSASVVEMREILATYDIPDDMIHFVPTQKLYSSYIGDMWIVENSEDLKAKLAAYSAMMRSAVRYGIDLSTVSIIYTYPVFSSSVDPNDLPWAELREIAFRGKNATAQIGAISEITLDESNFDQMIGPHPHYDELSQTIRQNNVAAYKVIPYSDNAPNLFSFYYVLRQNDGSVLVACCCTNNDGEFSLIREIFKD